MRTVLLAAMLLTLVPGAARADDEPEASAPVLALGATAPEFTLPAYNPQAVGQAVVALSSMVGSDCEAKDVKAVLVSFMASWCKPCKKELPFLQELSAKFKDKGLRVLVVSIDKEDAGQNDVRAIIEKDKLTVPVLKDRFNFVARRWLGDKSPLPSVFLVDPDGKIALAHAGYQKDARQFLESEVEKALAARPAEPPPPPAAK